MSVPSIPRRRIKRPLGYLIGCVAFFWAIAATGLSPIVWCQQPTTTPLKTLDDHFPFSPPASVQDWNRRAVALRRQVAVAAGLFPMPTRPPVVATIHSKIQRDGFTVEKVYFESLPGHFVTGLLFRPAEDADELGSDASRNVRRPDVRRPGVLCPHGHGGRNQRYDPATMADLMRSGDEPLAESGSMPKIARCAELARLGCVSFIFDMLGYGDSVQIDFDVAHRRKTRRGGDRVPSDSAPRQFFSTPADARLQSIFGLQTFNALRSLDFLASLPDVDPSRLAVTGGSGGGTQTILLGALDDRVSVSFPNGMVSTSMQGGCPCENACGLRIGTGNVELAALFAPKPMAMTAADDWTRDMMNDGFPELKQIYAMLGKPDHVDCTPLLQFQHNYNFVTRGLMLSWMNRHLRLHRPEPILQTDFPALTESELAVWDQLHPRPTTTGAAHERDVLTWWDGENKRLLRRAIGSSAVPSEFDRWVRPALRAIVDVDVPQQVEASVADELGLMVFEPGKVSHGPTILWLDAVGELSPSSKATIGELPAAMSRWVDAGHRLVVMPVRYDGQPWANATTQRMNDAPPHTIATTFGYNRPAAVTACGRVLAAVAWIDQHKRVSDDDAPRVAGGIHLVAPGAAASIAIPAAAIAGPLVDQATIAVDGFRFGDIRDPADVDFIPGMTKYGDIGGWAAARAPYPLTLTGEFNNGESSAAFGVSAAIYAAMDASAAWQLKD